jgi:hypothetical protein
MNTVNGRGRWNSEGSSEGRNSGGRNERVIRKVTFHTKKIVYRKGDHVATEDLDGIIIKAQDKIRT